MTRAEVAGPGAALEVAKMPGHWVLSRLGKTVLRPGGMELTSAMLAQLGIGAGDNVVEFAPGLGVTARRTLACGPATYTAVERDRDAAALVQGYLDGETERVVVGTAQDTGLAASSATVVYGEALLTMQTPSTKQAIVAEAARLLQPGGRYAMHEIAVKEQATPEERAALEAALLGAIKVGARPLATSEWEALLAAEGLRILHRQQAPMALLEPARLLADEGLRGVLRILFRALTQPALRRRALAMRRAFRRHAHLMTAVLLVATKDAEA